tara:strand:+ start:147 stop:527 length:381 start_codon:yes stop_codon:yes gene_type:complete
MFSEFIRYLCAGTVNTFVGYMSIIFFQTILDLSPELSNLLGYSIGLAISFILNKSFVFNIKKGNSLAFGIKFIWAFIISYLINFMSLIILLKANIAAFIAQAISMMIYSLCFYFICKHYVFIKSKL